ncbi:GTPase HflX [bacterium BMS3Bbin01]|nr:GTPase HflX [bacterium BMS3Bbin01]
MRDVLADLGAAAIPELLALNKQDSADPIRLHRLLALHPEALAFSAATGEGIDALVERIGSSLAKRMHNVTLMIPYERSDILSILWREAEVLHEEHGEDGIAIRVRVPERRASLVHEFLTDKPPPQS